MSPIAVAVLIVIAIALAAVAFWWADLARRLSPKLEGGSAADFELMAGLGLTDDR